MIRQRPSQSCLSGERDLGPERAWISMVCSVSCVACLMLPNHFLSIMSIVFQYVDKAVYVHFAVLFLFLSQGHVLMGSPVWTDTWLAMRVPPQ